MLVRRQVDAADVEVRSEAPGLLVEEERELAVHQEVVVDGSQSRAELQLRLLVAQVHGSSQGQVVVPRSIKRVLESGESKGTC